MPPSFNSQMIAEMIQGTIVGDPTVTVNGFAKIEEAKSGDLAFLGNEKYTNYLSSTQASIIIMSRRLFNEDTKPRHATIILVDEAYQAMNTLLEAYQALTSQQVKNEIHSSAVVEENTSIAADVHVGPLCVISQGSSIGAQTMLVAQVYIGRNVRIGSGTTIHPGVRILDNCTIGNNVIIHANAVIGADGFGYVPTPNGGYKKTPQLGAVVIEDWVEIGANTTIDRASLGNTLIQEGVKIDNLVQVAHNVQIGAHTAIAAQAGISGSTKIGEHSIIGGQAGIVGHIQLAEGTKINAQSGVTKTIKEKNTAWTGSPAGPYQETLRNQLLSRKLSDLFRKVEELTAALKQKNED